MNLPRANQLPTAQKLCNQHRQLKEMKVCYRADTYKLILRIKAHDWKIDLQYEPFRTPKGPGIPLWNPSCPSSMLWSSSSVLAMFTVPYQHIDSRMRSEDIITCACAEEQTKDNRFAHAQISKIMTAVSCM